MSSMPHRIHTFLQCHFSHEDTCKQVAYEIHWWIADYVTTKPLHRRLLLGGSDQTSPYGRNVDVNIYHLSIATLPIPSKSSSRYIASTLID
jgi:hypothetical protein